jgi:hypothetical protein
MAELKHIGRVKATNRKCLVAYRTLPGDAYHCLVVATENLPDAWHDALINLVESNAGQTAYEFAEALDRTQFPDGSRMLPALHGAGRLVRVQTSEVEMTPTNSFAILLSELNQVIAEQRGVAVDELSLKPSIDSNEAKELAIEKAKSNDSDVTKTTSQSVNEENATITLSPEAQAKDFRSKADRLAKEAAQFRRMAEELVPTKKKD